MVTKLYVKDGVCVCVKVVCEREHVTKLSVKDGVKDGVCERWCVTKMVCERGCVKDGV